MERVTVVARRGGDRARVGRADDGLGRTPRPEVRWLPDRQRAGGAGRRSTSSPSFDVLVQLGKAENWDGKGSIDDFLPQFKEWDFGWLDVPAIVEAAPETFLFPMVDRDQSPSGPLVAAPSWVTRPTRCIQSAPMAPLKRFSTPGCSLAASGDTTMTLTRP